MAEKNSFVLFYELEEQTAEFTDAQLGQLLRAVFDFEMRGNQPEITDVAVRTAFRFVAAQLNRGRAKYEDTCLKRQAAGKMGGRPSKPKGSDEKQKNQMVLHESKKTKKSYRDSERDPECDSDSERVPDREGESGHPSAAAPTPTKPERHKRGTYGWVKLSEEEYTRLSNDLGQAEFERCVAYIDESAQSTGNKNKWRDWNLVIRRCSKQGWGLNQPRKGDTHGVDEEAAERGADYYTRGFHTAGE